MLFSDGQFDWTDFDSGYDADLLNGTLIISTLRTRFEMKVQSPLSSTMWMLGLYQAEGRKTIGAGGGFELTNKSRVILQGAVEALGKMGISKDRLQLYVRHERVAEKEALEYYQPLGLEMTPREVNNEKEMDFNGVLCVKKSAALAALIRAVLISGEIKIASDEAKWAFLLGFLAGDGAITMSSTGIVCRGFCGSHEEALMIRELMDHLMPVRTNQEEPKEPRQTGNGFMVGRSINPFDAIELIVRGAFKGTYSRIRLFHSAHTVDEIKVSGANRRWGNIDGDGNVTPKVLEARARLAQFDDEWNHIKERWPTMKDSAVKRKGMLYEYPEWGTGEPLAA